MKKICFLLFLSLLGTSLSAQRIDSFPTNPNAFLPVFEEFMLSAELKELEKEFEEFKSAYLAGAFSETEQQTIIQVANKMRKDRMTAIPYFRAYLQTLTALKKLDGEQKHFEKWHEILLGFLSDADRSKLEFKSFLTYCLAFFDNQILRYSSGGTNWAASSGDFTFVYENKIPYLAYEETDLLAFRKEDTMRIRQTKGRYQILEETWIGESGRVDWDDSGSEGEIYVTFEDYELDLRKSFYEIDSVLFHHEQYFGSRSVLGNFTDKITNSGNERRPSYPRFESLEGNLNIQDFGEGVSYYGGFSLHGSTVYGTAINDKKATIQIKNEDQKLVFKATSNRFSVQEGKELQSQDVQAVFYHENDSISHPSVILRYDIPSGEIELSRGETGSDRNPFYSSAHGVNIHSEYIVANINSDTVILGKKLARFLNKEPVSFESLNYFDRREYEKLQGLSSVNPLVMLMRVFKSYGESRFVPLSAIISVYGSAMSKESVITLLYSLSKKGFVNYNSETEMVEIKDKVRHFAESYFGQRDYDRISIISDTIAINAFLDLRDNSIAIQGVKKLELSPFRRVGLLPDSNKMVLQPNMDMDFNGQLFAGYTDFTGKDFHFDYDAFIVEMDTLREMRFFPPAKDPILFPNTPAYALTSTLENTSGRIYIDKRDNKSGKDSIPAYPIFSTDAPSFVYYDDSTYVKDTAYVRDSFYFEVAPFELDSLGNYRKEDLRFAGKMISAEIFPEFDEIISVREDYSLGFEHMVPEAGYSTYGDLGLYRGELDLSNKGFLGDGILDYLGASIRSEDLVFRPKNTTGSANAFDLPESRGGEIETPLVHADEVGINWLPYRDSMYIISKEFDVFQSGDFKFQGTMTLTPGGVKGQGRLNWEKAQVSSDLLSFGANSVEGDSLSISIRSLGSEDAIAMRTDNLRGRIDFDEGIGQLESNDSSYVSLKRNNYISTMNAFRWDLNEEDLSLQREDRGMGNFISLVEGQDSLQFLGRVARIDLQTNNLLVNEAPHVNSADAMIIPDSNQIIVMPGGKMATLENAVILADSVSKRHKITNATVNILGRKAFNASGFYEYNVGGKEQNIEFSDIVGERYGKGPISKRPTVTRAAGSVVVPDSFLIDDKTLFQGEISLFSQKKDLHFNGFAQLNAENLPKKSWFAIDCDADKSNLIIPYNYPRDQEGFKVFTGFYLGRDMPVVYPSVMSPPYTLQDRKVLDVTGVFKYDKNTDQFIFGDSAKVVGNAVVGNQLIFDNKTGELSGEGRLGLCDDLEYTSLDVVGTANTRFLDVPDSLRAETPPAPFELEIMSGVKFIFPDRLFRFIEAEVERNNLTSTLIPYLADKDKYKKQFSTLFAGKPGLPEILNGVEGGAVSFPNKVNDYTILMTDLKMKWDMDYQSFVSTSPQLGLVSINGTPINKRIEGYVEYKMPSVGGDRFYYYLKFPSQIFYYFGFRQGVLEVYSNDSQFMDAAANMKSKELVTKMPDGNTYEILIQTASRANMFIRRVKAAN
ncbi:MAG TPA: hypothetical protein VJ953_08995 [Saprospiraceae bacterium]|nr:hypothetical protein [Saprospiraceae bacterium]